MVDKLTAKQKLIYDFLKQEIKQNGYPPTVREICEAVGLSSTSTVHAHLATLERKGMIKRTKTKNRSTEILDNSFYSNRELVSVPIIGKVAAGVPILAEENVIDTFPIPIEYLQNSTCFMLSVEGDSMIESGILSGDLVLVRQQPAADEGDIVIAMLDDSATVKKFYREGDKIKLMPSNSAMSPIITDEADVLGKVIGLYRRY